MTDGRLSRDDSLIAFRGATWIRCQLRKERACTECREAISEHAQAYRPLREAPTASRHNRLCCSCAPTHKRSDCGEPDGDGRRFLLIEAVPNGTARHFARVYGGTVVAVGDGWNVEQGKASP